MILENAILYIRPSIKGGYEAVVFGEGEKIVVTLTQKMIANIGLSCVDIMNREILTPNKGKLK